MADSLGLVRKQASGVFGGFTNMFYKEFVINWITQRGWIIQLLVWFALINGASIFMTFVLPLFTKIAPSLSNIMIFPSIAIPLLPFGAVFIIATSIADEIKSGTAEWIISKPLSREGFILSKFLGNYLGLVSFGIIINFFLGLLLVFIGTKTMPGTIGPVTEGAGLEFIPILKMIGLLMVHVLFYMALTTFTTAISTNLAFAGGIPLIFFVLQGLIETQITKIADWLPILLPNQLSKLINGSPLPTDLPFVPVVATIAWSIMFLIIAMFIFRNREF